MTLSSFFEPNFQQLNAISVCICAAAKYSAWWEVSANLIAALA
jgi:hypothetical protein